MINLLPRKEFEITLSDGTVIKGKFGTWALNKLCIDYKLKLTEVESKLQELPAILSYLLAAVQCNARETGTAFSYTDVHASNWIDEMGGIASENFVKLISWSGEEVKAEDEKKSEVT